MGTIHSRGRSPEGEGGDALETRGVLSALKVKEGNLHDGRRQCVQEWKEYFELGMDLEASRKHICATPCNKVLKVPKTPVAGEGRIQTPRRYLSLGV